MKKVLFFTISFLSAVNLLAQNVGIGTNTPDASAKLDVVDANRGVLIPRVALTNTTVAAPVTTPATSLLVYNTNTAGDVTPGFYYWNGTVWVRLLNTQSNDWKLDGNNNGVLRYIGTNDNYDFPILTNGTERMRVTTAGNVGIGTAAPNTRLVVSGVADVATEPQLRIFNPNNAVNETAGLRMRIASGWDVRLQTVQGVDWFQLTSAAGVVQHSMWANRFYPGASSANGVNTGYISGNGTFIGVGTVTPTQRLHVAGGSILTDRAYAASTLNLAAAAAINIAQPATQVLITNVAGAQANTVNYSALAIEGQYLWISNTDDNAATFAGATIPSNTAMGFVYTGGAWRPVRAMDSQGDWKLDGNNNGVLRTIGTNDNFDFPIITNGTEKMRITAGGNVGIGTTTPGAKLHIVGGGSFGVDLRVNGRIHTGDANGWGGVWLDNGQTMFVGQNGTNVGFWISGPGWNAFQITNASNVGIGTTVPTSKLGVVGNLAVGGTYGALAAPTGGAIIEGNVGIGTTAPTEKLHVQDGSILIEQTPSSLAVPFLKFNGSPNLNMLGIRIYNPDNPTNKYVWWVARDNSLMSIEGGTTDGEYGTYYFLISENGNVGIGTTTPSEKLEVCGNAKVVGTIIANSSNLSAGVFCSSDIHYKKDITPLTNALNNVMQLRGVNYFWKTKEFPEKQFPDTKQIGFIAQELEKVYPEVVFTDKDGYKSVDYSRLTPILVEAIKDQQKIILDHQKIIQQLQEENFKIKQTNLQLKEENNQMKAEMKMLNDKVDNLINSLSNHKKLVTTE